MPYRVNTPSAAGPLKLLLASCLVLPFGLFVVASWLNYRAAFAEAYLAVERSADIAHEQALKILDSQVQVADRVAEMLRGQSLSQIKANERDLHNAFADIVIRLPQIQSVLAAAADGHPLVSASSFPVREDLLLQDRDYFKAIVVERRPLFLTEVQQGAMSGLAFIGLAQPWTAPDGSLRGLIDVSVSPDVFEDFYAVLAAKITHQPDMSISLMRDDGRTLLRYPPLADIPSTGPRGFAAALAAHPDAGRFEGTSNITGEQRIFAYRKVQGYPALILVGSSRESVIDGWLLAMRGQLLYGFPLMLAVLAIGWSAFVRLRKEETALARLRQEMGRREKAEDALLRSQRLEAVGQLTGGVAHDFNNLLTIILGSAEALGRRPDDPARVLRIAGQIGFAAQRGGEITQQLLAFSRRQFVNPQALDLNRCLEEFRPLLERASNESIRVVYDLQPGLPAALVDPGQFEAAVLNLVGNARDAMPAGGTITISTGTAVLRPADGEAVGCLSVRVSDTGEGMDAETVAKAVEPFFTTKGIGRGTGLGLSQVYGFAKQAGGDMQITSSPGQGTAVDLLLPWTERPTPASPVPNGGAEPQPIMAGAVILVVEDEPDLLRTVLESLDDLGYATLAASTADEALRVLGGGERIDLLFSDVTLPGGADGYGLAQAARTIRPGLRLLLTSGYAPVEARTKGLSLLTKPYDRGGLDGAIRAALAGPATPLP